ncbi:hypothetical protein B566_EDAN007397 [Ephemera danica]|nr:hypothetical protein B566_EDAN007397 [Ephemera danica]
MSSKQQEKSAGKGTTTSNGQQTNTPVREKSRRKISLPWFRQGSCSGAHPTLSRQHTIDSPGSFLHSRFLRGKQPSSPQTVRGKSKYGMELIRLCSGAIAAVVSDSRAQYSASSSTPFP